MTRLFFLLSLLSVSCLFFVQVQSQTASNSLVANGVYYVVPMQAPSLCLGTQALAQETIVTLANCAAQGPFSFTNTHNFAFQYTYNTFSSYLNPDYGWNVFGGNCVPSAYISMWTINPVQNNDYFYYNSSTYQITMSLTCPGNANGTYCLQLNSTQVGGNMTVQPCQANNIYQQFGFISVPLPPTPPTSAYNSLVINGVYNVVPLQNPTACLGTPALSQETSLLLYNCSNQPSFSFTSNTNNIAFQYTDNNFASYLNPDYGWNVYGGSCVQAATLGIWTIQTEAINDYFYYNSTTYQIFLSPSCPGNANGTMCLQFTSAQVGGSVTVQPCQANNLYQQFGFVSVPLPAVNSLVPNGVYNVIPKQNPSVCVGTPSLAQETALLLYNCSAQGPFSYTSSNNIAFQYNNNNFASYLSPGYGWNVWGGNCVPSAYVAIWTIASEATNNYFYYNSTSYQITMSPSCNGNSAGTYCLQFSTIVAGGNITVQPCQANNVKQQFGFINVFPGSSSSSSSSSSSTPLAIMSSSTASQGGGSGLSSGAIAGIVIGCVVGVCLLICIVLFCCFGGLLGTSKADSYKNTDNVTESEVEESTRGETEMESVH